MKRSEMVEKVTFFLLDDISRLFSHKDQADEIIKLMEKEGMLPPDNGSHCIRDFVYIWEPEDE